MRFHAIIIVIMAGFLVVACGGPQPLDEELDSLLATSALSAARGAGGCTRGGSFWKTHNAYASDPANRTPWPISEDKHVCGQRIVDLVSTPIAPGDAWHATVRMAIATILNISSGASAPREVEEALDLARTFAPRCAVSGQAERDAAFRVMRTLDTYNHGQLGPPACR